MNSSQRLSLIVITRNEERDIRDCLESVSGLADEIVVVDSGSTDRTVDICRSYTDKIFTRQWDGYGPQKQFAMDKAAGPWILNLDADERLSPDLKTEIQTVLARSTNGLPAGYTVPFVTYFLNHRLRFGGSWGERHLRLFRKDHASYPPRAVHEGIAVSGAHGKLTKAIVHFSYHTLHDYLVKCNDYTSLIARRKYERGERFHLYHHLRLPYEFVVRYVLKLGFLDGGAGLTYALLSAYYGWLKYLKLKDMETKT